MEKNNNKNNYLVNGSDIFSKKSDQAEAGKGQLGYPTVSQTRCCSDNFGTPRDLLSSEPMPVQDYGLPFYSALNKSYNLDEKDKKIINDKIVKNNLNPEETYVKIIDKSKNRNAILGKDVLSYRIISKKDKSKF